MRVALLQLTVSDDPSANLASVLTLFDEAVSGGADFILTPEMTNCLSSSREHQASVYHHEEDDPSLAALRGAAARAGKYLLIGSLGLKTHDADGRFANRSFLIGPDGAILARYDKIHMFDVTVSESEAYRESAGYRPGSAAVTAETPFGILGMSICYDLRFPHLFRALAHAGASILTVPAAFNDTTGRAHWEVLLRARAIENGAFVLAPAQCGFHPETNGRGRRTWGHSLVVAPWGEILADGGENPGVTFAEIGPEAVERARGRVPSIHHDRAFSPPQPGACRDE